MYHYILYHTKSYCIWQQLRTQDGTRGEVVHVDDEVARVDFNDPLAGETLEFDLEVLAVN
jgi:FKBP-type peptidyl-prolyl cis-trans isomerase 2